MIAPQATAERESVMLASTFTVAQSLGLSDAVALVIAESVGLPTPGEAALVTAAILAARAKLQIEFVIALAAPADMIGGAPAARSLPPPRPVSASSPVPRAVTWRGRIASVPA
ncbi:MAG: hypothetical protein M3065_14230 [Actinomycetota bacterium]|nr:hypothetical protein [Actinomycetota bacterium]